MDPQEKNNDDKNTDKPVSSISDNKAENTSEERNKIENLKSNIYSRNYPDIAMPQKLEFKPESYEAKHFWKEQEERGVEMEKEANEIPTTRKMSLPKKIFLAALIFFIISVGVASFVFFTGINTISATKVTMSFVGPVSIGAGEPLTVNIIVDNANETDLINPQLFIDYPDGTKKNGDIVQDLLHDTVNLDTIPSHQSSQKTIQAVLFGKEQQNEQIKVKLEYNIKGSNELFIKEKEYDVVISSTPLSLDIKHDSEVISHQQLNMSVTVSSNSSTVLHNVLLQATYPIGFQFVSATATPNFGSNNLWLIPIIKPGEKQVITFSGIMEGQDNEQRIFTFNVGLQNSLNDKEISTIFLKDQQLITIKKSPLDARLVLNDSVDPNPVMVRGSTDNAILEITNNTTDRILDSSIHITFSGGALDPNSVNVTSGFYRSSDLSIQWDKNSQSELASIDPGQTAKVAFSFAALPDNVSKTLRNGSISMNINVQGNKSSQVDGSILPLSVSVSRIIKVSTLFSLSPRIIYSFGPFKNTGPIPPKANVPTTYTIILYVSNSANDVTDGIVTASLPNYVSWSNKISPANTNISYDPDRHIVTWNVGYVPAGTGYTSSSKEVAFQVSFLPASSQIGTFPVIIRPFNFAGTDTFTGLPLQVTTNPLDTTLSTDPRYELKDTRVTQ